MTATKHIQASDRASIESALRAADTPVAPTFVGGAIAGEVPATWDGSGDPPLGWSRGWDSYALEDGTVVVIASDALVAAVPALAAAPDYVVPEDPGP